MQIKSSAVIRVVIMLGLFAYLIFALVFEVQSRKTKTALHKALEKEVLTKKDVEELAGQEPDLVETTVNGSYSVETFYFRSGIPGRKLTYVVVYGRDEELDPSDWQALEGKDDTASPSYLHDAPELPDTGEEEVDDIDPNAGMTGSSAAPPLTERPEMTKEGSVQPKAPPVAK